MSVLVAAVASSAMAQQEHVIRVQNNVRVGYDDNVYLNANEVESAFITDILNISGKLNFSGRTDAVFSYQPEVRYLFDGEPSTSTYHDLYGQLNHALSTQVFMTLSDRARYQMRDAQDGQVSQTDANYFENDLKGALDITVSELYNVKLGGGYQMRLWDDDNYGEWNSITMSGGNNFDEYDASASVIRDLNDSLTKAMVGVDYSNLEYDGGRGGYDAVVVMGGADHIFSQYMTGFGRVGATMASVDNMSGSEDTTSPYFNVGMDYNPTDKTSFNTSAGYSIYRSQNSFYNSQDRLNVGVGVSHDLTSKISIASSLSYFMGWYDSTVAINGAATGLDVQDSTVQWSVRGSYQINRNNFVELGYQFTDRSIDAGLVTDYQRNRVDLGWRLRL